MQKPFGSMRNPENLKNAPDLGSIAPPDGVETHIFSDPELDSSDISITSVRPYKILPDTVENRSSKIPLAIANAIVTRRFERLAKAENSPSPMVEPHNMPYLTNLSSAQYPSLLPTTAGKIAPGFSNKNSAELSNFPSQNVNWKKQRRITSTPSKKQ